MSKFQILWNKSQIFNKRWNILVNDDATSNFCVYLLDMSRLFEKTPSKTHSNLEPMSPACSRKTHLFTCAKKVSLNNLFQSFLRRWKQNENLPWRRIPQDWRCIWFHLRAQRDGSKTPAEKCKSARTWVRNLRRLDETLNFSTQPTFFASVSSGGVAVSMFWMSRYIPDLTRCSNSYLVICSA